MCFPLEFSYDFLLFMGSIPICCKLETNETNYRWSSTQFVILKIDEDILGDSKMKINTFIYKLFEIKSVDQPRKLLGTKIVLEMSVHNLATFVSNLDVS